jgi:hypothetical protein
MFARDYADIEKTYKDMVKDPDPHTQKILYDKRTGTAAICASWTCLCMYPYNLYQCSCIYAIGA